MKISVILYGCVEYLAAQTANQQRISEALTRTFGIELSQLIGEGVQKSPEITVTACWYQMPVPRTFIADVICEGELEKGLHKKMTEGFGRLWMEYVRTFIDSGALIAIRLADSKAHYEWSPHEEV